jgi:DNA processing protein
MRRRLVSEAVETHVADESPVGEPDKSPGGEPVAGGPIVCGSPDQLRDLVCLNMVEGIGPALIRVLLRRFGSATAVLDAVPSRLRDVPGIGPKLASRLMAARREHDAAAELARCQQANVCIVCEGDAAFPAALRTIPTPPAFLYLRGELLPRDALAIAVVGSRHCSHYGLRQAERLAGSLARVGFTIVSGLARGIDAAAHRGALAAGGRTIAVLANGLALVYPPEHKDLAEQVAGCGALVSETPMTFEPMAGLFHQRNRVISGLSLGVVVVEAADRSGALITARHAEQQNREVLAVPGPIDSPTSRGPHRLIRDGAKLVESADDVLEALGPLMTEVRPTPDSAVRHPLELTLNDSERQLLDLFGPEPVQADELVARSKLPAPQVLSTLSVLEMRRLVQRLAGNRYVRR